MADIKWSAFPSIGSLATGDILVGLRAGANVRFSALTIPWTVPNGGTGLTTATAYGLLAGGTTATGAFQSLSTGTSGQMLQSGGAGALPSWTTAAFPSVAGAAGTILRSNGTDWVASTSTFADTYTSQNILYASSSNTVAGFSLSSNSALIANGAGNIASLGYSTTATASNLVERDSNANTFANNDILNQTTTAAGGTITLTAASSKTQIISGAGATTVVLPAANTLALGWTYYINNNTASTVTVKYNDTTTTLTQILAGMYVQIYCNGIGSANGSWDYHWLIPANMANGQVVIGSTTSGPKAANLTAGSGVSITNAANSITIAASGAGFTYNSVSGTTQAAAAANAYILNNAAATTVTLPASGSSTIGDTIKIKGRSGTSFIIQANTSQIITYGATQSTAAGTATSAAGTDSIQLVYVASNEWSIDWALSSGFVLA